MKIKTFVLVLFCVLFVKNSFAQEVLDKIVAVVDNEIICQSELNFQVGLYASQKNIDPNTPGLRDQLLNALIEDKLAYSQAVFDTITVSDEEVNQRINYQIDNFTQQFGTTEAVEKAYGMSIEKIKKELRTNVTKSLMVQKLQDKNFGQLSVTRREVEDFYNIYKDSIAAIPEKFRVSHIFALPKVSGEAKEKYHQKALALLDSVKAGSDFSALAKKYSEDPGSAVKGGDLGFTKRGMLFSEFESVAYDLKPGQTSGVVETPVGYHIIQLIERRGDNIRARHILVKFKNDDEAEIKAIEKLSAIRDTVVKGLAKFQDMAKKYSEDRETAPFGGFIGEFYVNQLDKTLGDIVSKMEEGEISYPKRIDYGKDMYGYHIVWLEKRIAKHTANMKDDYAELERMTQTNKKQKLYQKWMDDLKKKIYWEIRL
jgi:peptidyl-prolyl cis-trans isomerase SurA